MAYPTRAVTAPPADGDPSVLRIVYPQYPQRVGDARARVRERQVRLDERTVLEGGGRPYGGVEDALDGVLYQLVRAKMVTG